MADVAQQQANSALAQTGGDAITARGIFDAAFSKIYAGLPMNTVSNALDLYRNGPVHRMIGSYYLGETAFKVG